MSCDLSLSPSSILSPLLHGADISVRSGTTNKVIDLCEGEGTPALTFFDEEEGFDLLQRAQTPFTPLDHHQSHNRRR